ncbi:hypothetical protein [Flavobacterium sp. UGB4466]|uniref:hypothetical protein n=1 Tax=Flavobacterium sp. UGB4466 TaxID=2730889 RepID=UPI00192BB66E|nr:hypothetical protein [Flavobacterium sp. UGB4466]
MKKAALVLGIFSLVMVSTSFSSPEVPNNLSASAVFFDGSIFGGGATNQGRQKADVASLASNLKSNSKQLSSFASDSQSTRMTVKVD